MTPPKRRFNDFFEAYGVIQPPKERGLGD